MRIKGNGSRHVLEAKARFDKRSQMPIYQPPIVIDWNTYTRI